MKIHLELPRDGRPHFYGQETLTSGALLEAERLGFRKAAGQRAHHTVLQWRGAFTFAASYVFRKKLLHAEPLVELSVRYDTQDDDIKSVAEPVQSWARSISKQDYGISFDERRIYANCPGCKRYRFVEVTQEDGSLCYVCSDKFDRARKMANEPSGYVYVFRVFDTDIYKIGKSSASPERRMGEVFGATEIVLARRVPHYSRCERGLHERFRDSRLQGEAFRLSSANLEELGQFLDNWPSQAGMFPTLEESLEQALLESPQGAPKE